MDNTFGEHAQCWALGRLAYPTCMYACAAARTRL